MKMTEFEKQCTDPYGSADYLWLMDPDSEPDPDADLDPAIFVSELQDVNKKWFFTYSFLEQHLHNFSKIKSHKGVTKQ